ncbi:GHKL domain-containing protein [Fusibacter paucivorans]|uniref:histidine kinase n=1 Tax=Fusibacter paucivorans TaxID=76009 RepID=A0ABS5PRF8_9FIRM|nr:ATP-binding protein [Fusibacter paucivorans]MBS7527750.1 GHKL domain-containing protein [Fusibacter paucivorans]
MASDWIKYFEAKDAPIPYLKMLIEGITSNIDEQIFVLSAKGEVLFQNDRHVLNFGEELIIKMQKEIVLMQMLHQTYRKSYLGICQNKSQEEGGCQKRMLDSRFEFFYRALSCEAGTCFFVTIKDTTALLQNEQVILDLNYQLNDKIHKINEAELKLMDQDRLVAIGHLASGIAHEINNPLGYVKSDVKTMHDYLEQLIALYKTAAAVSEGLDQWQRQHPSNELLRLSRMLEAEVNNDDIHYIVNDYAALMKEMTIGIHRVENIISNLKQFSKLDQTGSVTPYDLNAGLHQILASLHHKSKKAVHIETVFGEVPMTLAHGNDVNQALQNILLNALDAFDMTKQESDHYIKVTTYSDKAFLCCDILDNGSGIMPKDAIKVFEPFFTTKAIGKGCGLGLSIAYDIVVNRHCGTLQFETAPKEGSLFKIRLPIRSIDHSMLDEFTNHL